MESDIATSDDHISLCPKTYLRNKKTVFDKHIYKERHKIENLFSRLKRNRRVATRHKKTRLAYQAIAHLASITLHITL